MNPDNTLIQSPKYIKVTDAEVMDGPLDGTPVLAVRYPSPSGDVQELLLTRSVAFALVRKLSRYLQEQEERVQEEMELDDDEQ